MAEEKQERPLRGRNAGEGDGKSDSERGRNLKRRFWSVPGNGALGMIKNGLAHLQCASPRVDLRAETRLLDISMPKNIKHLSHIASQFTKISPCGDIFVGVYA